MKYACQHENPNLSLGQRLKKCLISSACDGFVSRWKTLNAVLIFMTLAAGAILVTAPFAWMITTAFKTLPEALSPKLVWIPAQWQWRNVIEVFEVAPFGRYFLNSAFIGTFVTAAVIFTSLTAGYAFAKLKFPGRDFIFGIVLATMMTPFEVTLIPNFILIKQFGWYNTYAALTVPWCANAFSIFLMRQAFRGLPTDYFDAAKVDGCGHLRFLFHIAVPLTRPAIVTVGLFAFLGSYNSLLWPLIVTSEDTMRVVQVGLTVYSCAEGVRLHLLMCASTIVILPTVALYLVAQRYFLETSLGSGIKG